MQYPDHLLKLIALFKKLPGVGTKSAERYAFQLLDWPKEKLAEMGEAISETKEKLKQCEECGCIIENHCFFCTHPQRDHETLCVTASTKDIFSIEQTREYRGLYHVLGALLSPIGGLAPTPQAIAKLKERVIKLKIREMIFALDSTLEGDATALYLKKELEALGIKTSRLALGIPMGSSLEYIDGGTLARALAGRHTY